MLGATHTGTGTEYPSSFFLTNVLICIPEVYVGSYTLGVRLQTL